MKLLSYHNLHFIQKLMKEIREAISNGKFEKLKKEYEKY
jgi:tRNA-guanine family transglycosylase